VSEVKPLGPAYLVHGSDRPKVDQALRRLRDRIEAAGGSVERVQAGDGNDESTAAPAGVVLECNAMGLLGGPRLVLVAGVEAWKAEQSLTVLVEYLAAPAPDATLALVASDALDAKHPLASGKLAGIDVLVYNLPERRGLPEWIGKAARAAGASIDRDAVARLLELGGDDAQSLSSEMCRPGISPTRSARETEASRSCSSDASSIGATARSPRRFRRSPGICGRSPRRARRSCVVRV
jgi:DNA polymerase III delta subunit